MLPPTRQPDHGLRLTGYVEHVLEPDAGIIPSSCRCLDWSPSLADYPEAYAQYLEAGPGS